MITVEKVDDLVESLLRCLSRAEGEDLERIVENLQGLERMRERLAAIEAGEVIDFGAHRARVARAAYADASQRLTAYAMRRARPAVTIAALDALIERLIENLGELELVRRQLRS